MNVSRSLNIALTILTVFLLTACSTENKATEVVDVLPTDTQAPPTLEPTPEPTIQPTEEALGLTVFEQLGISLEVPEELYVIKEPIINLDDPSRLQAYTFFIQNNSPTEGPKEDYFQMYGFLQYDLPLTTWEEYAGDVLGSDMYAYAEEIEVNGLPGIDSQFTGQRNRFVYHFFLDGHILSIAVSDPTEANKLLADQIISTLQFTPGSLTDSSQIE